MHGTSEVYAVGYEGPACAMLLDGEALRGKLTALAAANYDRGVLRKEAMLLIKTAFLKAREQVKEQVERENLAGILAARALSAIQDTAIQVIYDFAVTHFYPSNNPTSAEHVTIVATGGYGRGELAPGSDVDLLFVRPFKQTPWGESVIEFILYMLWDLGLKVGHATRSLPECVRLAKQDITIRTALLEARYLWGDEALYEELRKKFWSEIATGTGQDFVEAKLAERDERHHHQGESRYLVEPNIKEGKGGLRDLQTLYWIGKYLYHVYDAAELVRAQRLHQGRIQDLPESRSLSVGCARASALSDGPRRGASFLRRAARIGRATRLHRRHRRATPWKISCAPTSWSPRMSAT